MTATPAIQVQALGSPPWPTLDPFLFCVHHDDAYPRGNGSFGPAASLAGRQIGQDFAGKDGWRMYHGRTVPGFPSHPHRGFETVTIVRKGLIDHSDSLGAAARFGGGDVQWLTAGSGIQHSEMFPLLDGRRAEPAGAVPDLVEPAGPQQDGGAPLHDVLVGRHSAPRAARRRRAPCRGGVHCRPLRAARGHPLLPPPPDSWAAQPGSDLAIWTLKLAPHARLTLPPARAATALRRLYYFKGAGLRVAGQGFDEQVAAHAAIDVPVDQAVALTAGGEAVELLMLQGCPIGELVAQYGPFVMNTRAELQQAFDDYQRTRFGGWPWPDAAPVHGAQAMRFAQHLDGRRDERPLQQA